MKGKKRNKRSGNIEPPDHFDPFPKSGLVKQYEPFIRNAVGEFCAKYPSAVFDHVRADAVRLAVHAEAAFKPELGNDFSTFLRWHLKGLHRLIQADQNQIKVPGPTKEEREAEAEAEAKQKAEDATPPVRHAGGNGARITLDLQWTSNNSFHSRHRIVIGTQLRSGDEGYARGVMERISADMPKLLANEPLSSIRPGFLRAIADMAECRQREVDQEAENQKNGDYRPVFLEPQRLQLDIGLHKGRKPPKLDERPRGIIMVSWHDAAGHDEDGNPLLLLDVIGGAEPDPNAGEDVQRLLDAIKAERPFLSGKEGAMLAWKLNPQGLSLTQHAAKEGISKGYASKLNHRIEEKLARRFKR